MKILTLRFIIPDDIAKALIKEKKLTYEDGDITFKNYEVKFDDHMECFLDFKGELK